MMTKKQIEAALEEIRRSKGAMRFFLELYLLWRGWDVDRLDEEIKKQDACKAECREYVYPIRGQ